MCGVSSIQLLYHSFGAYPRFSDEFSVFWFYILLLPVPSLGYYLRHPHLHSSRRWELVRKALSQLMAVSTYVWFLSTHPWDISSPLWRCILVRQRFYSLPLEYAFSHFATSSLTWSECEDHSEIKGTAVRSSSLAAESWHRAYTSIILVLAIRKHDAWSYTHYVSSRYLSTDVRQRARLHRVLQSYLFPLQRRPLLVSHCGSAYILALSFTVPSRRSIYINLLTIKKEVCTLQRVTILTRSAVTTYTNTGIAKSASSISHTTSFLCVSIILEPVGGGAFNSISRSRNLDISNISFEHIRLVRLSTHPHWALQ